MSTASEEEPAVPRTKTGLATCATGSYPASSEVLNEGEEGLRFDLGSLISGRCCSVESLWGSPSCSSAP